MYIPLFLNYLDTCYIAYILNIHHSLNYRTKKTSRIYIPVFNEYLNLNLIVMAMFTFFEFYRRFLLK